VHGAIQSQARISRKLVEKPKTTFKKGTAGFQYKSFLPIN